MDTFNPNEHLIQIKGKDYLPVAWRLVWLRATHPEASIETELVRADERGVTVRADVSWPELLPAGDEYKTHIVHNTGYAMEPWDKPGRMGAALENAETSAIGRALAAAGFGTQFAPELDFDTAGERVADSPQPPPTRQRVTSGKYAHAANQSPESPRTMNPANMDEPATQPQIKAIFAIGRKLDIDVKPWVAEQFRGRGVDDLTRAEASMVIEDWQAELNAQPV